MAKKQYNRSFHERENDVWELELPNLGDMKRKNLDTTGCIGDGSSLRFRLGMYYTNKEYEKYRKKVLKTHRRLGI